jgi:hypothetical protein
MAAAAETSVFSTKYSEFVEDLLGTLPEYTSQIQLAKALDDKTRLNRFQEEVRVGNTFTGDDGGEAEFTKNPKIVLPGVEISDAVWESLSNNSRKAIWEYVRILSICCFMEAGFSDDSKPPAWMDDAMNDMKKKLEGADFQNIIKKFMTFFKSAQGGEGAAEGAAEGGAGTGAADEGATPSGLPSGFEKLFEGGFPKIPEKFLKGHMAKLAQEIVKDITPEELGISPEMIAECEKNPSRAFDILFQVFSNNPTIIQKTVQRIGKRLQQKIATGAIRPQEIAREAEELMKEFASNPSFVEMMEGIKGAFGFEDMGLARAAGRESSARLAMVKERLRKKAADKGAANKPPSQQGTTDTTQSEAAMAALLREESLRPSGGASSGASSGASGATNPEKKSQKKKPARNGKK